MSHGLFGTVGLPLHGWAQVAGFVHDHRSRVDWHRASAEQWTAGQWTDESGVMIAAGLHPSGAVRAVPGYLGDALTRAGRFDVVDGSGMIVADVLDTDGETVGRFCADSVQDTELELLAGDDAMTVVTGLVAHVIIHADAEAFYASEDSQLGDSRVSLPSFFPSGMFEDPWEPTSFVNAVVDDAWTVLVAESGEQVVVVRVDPLGGLGMYLCWPEALAPQPEPGQVVHAMASLTAFIPEVWRRTVARSPQSVVVPIDRLDPALHPLAVADGEVLHLMFREALSHAGLPWTFDRDRGTYEIAGQGQLTLGTLAALVGRCARQNWPAVVEERVTNIAATMASMDTAPTIEQMFPRLQVQRSDDDTPYPITGLVRGLEVLVGIDTPHSVKLVPDLEHVVDLGLGSLEEVMAAAFANLDGLPIPYPEVVTSEEGAITVCIFEFEDYFGASRLLTLPRVVHDRIGDAPFGVLAAIPDRQCLMVVVLDDGPALPALSWFSGLVRETFDDTHGPISAFVYHQCGDGPVEPVARRHKDGTLQIAVSEHFTAERVQG